MWAKSFGKKISSIVLVFMVFNGGLLGQTIKFKSFSEANKFVSDITGIAGTGGDFMDLIDNLKIKQLSQISEKLAKKIKNSNYAKGIQLKGLNNKISAGSSKGLETISKKIKTLSININKMKVEKAKLNVLSKKIPKMTPKFTKSIKVAGKIAKAAYLVDISAKGGVLIGQALDGTLKTKDTLNFILDTTSAIDKFYLIEGARHVEKTYEAILGKKTEIRNIRNKSVDEQEKVINYLIQNGINDRLKGIYKKDLIKAQSTEDILRIVNNAKRDNNNALKMIYKNLTDLSSKIINPDKSYSQYLTDKSDNIIIKTPKIVTKIAVKTLSDSDIIANIAGDLVSNNLKTKDMKNVNKKADEAMLNHIDTLQKQILAEMKNLNQKDSELLYAETAIAVKVSHEINIIKKITKKALKDFVILANTQIKTGNFNTFDKKEKSEPTVKELVEQEKSIQKTKLNEDVVEAKRLKKINTKLSEEYQALYVEAEKNPNDMNLQQQLKAKKTELGNNAYAFLELEKAIVKNNRGYTDSNGKLYSKGSKILDENGNPITVDGYNTAEKKAKNSVELVNFKIAEKERIKNEAIKKEQVAKEEQVKKVKTNIAKWQLEKKAKKSKADKLLAELNNDKKSGKKLDSSKVSTLRQLKKDISKLDKTIKIASSNIGEAIPVVAVTEKVVNKKSENADLSGKRKELTSKSNSQLKLVEKIQSKNQGIGELNNQINSKMSEINTLEKKLANLGGSSSGSKADRFKARSELIKLKMIKRIYDRYSGDITKISSSDRSKIEVLSNTLSGSWVQLFQNAPSRYISAKIKDRNLNLVSSSSSEAKAIQKKIDKLKKQVATLSDTANSINNNRQTLISQFDSSKQELLALLDDINDENKKNIGAERGSVNGGGGAESGSDNGGGGAGGGNDGDRGTPNYLEGQISYIGFNATGDSIGAIRIRANGDYEFSPIENLNNDISVTPSMPTESSPDIDGYKYTAWGNWAQSGLVTVADNGVSFNLNNSGHYIIGKTTLDMPKTGTATYSGSLIGDYLNRSNGSVGANTISGTIDITANFASSSVDASLNVNRNGSAWASVSTTASITNSAFSNDGNINNAVVGGGNAGVFGVFYGANAQEVGGGFWVDKQYGDGGGASGVFRAKQ